MSTIQTVAHEGQAPRVVAPQVEEQLINLSEKTNELLQRLGDLNMRLASVTREEEPEPSETAPEVAAVLVPIAWRISRTTDTVDDSLDILASIFRRLEV